MPHVLVIHAGTDEPPRAGSTEPAFLSTPTPRKEFGYVARVTIVLDSSNMTLPPLEARIAGLEGSYHQVSERLNSIDRRLDGFEQKMDNRFNAMDGRFAAMDSKIDGLQWRMTALIVGTWITVMLSIFFHR